MEDLSLYKEIYCDVIASSAGSAACIYTGQPFDTVKVRMQVEPEKYSKAVRCLQMTVRHETISSLWRGSVPAFMGALSENAVAFGINGILKRLFGSETNESQISYTKPILTGAITGFFTAFVLCPCDVVKCRAQTMPTATPATTAATTATNILKPNAITSTSTNTSSLHIAKQILRTHGHRGLFVGLNAQLLRDVPFGAAFFGSYEILCQIMKRNTTLSDSSVYFLSGG